MPTKKLDLNVCAKCRDDIRTSAYLGTGVCSDQCRKAVFKDIPTTIILSDEKLKERDDILRSFWRRKPVKP